MSLSKITQDHEVIRQWAEARGGKPAVVGRTEGEDDTGIIRLEFPAAPHANDNALVEISWEEWFDKFDSSGLQFTYQEHTAEGERSNFNKLTYPASTRSSAKSAASKTTASKKTSKSAAKKPAARKTPAKKSAKKSAAKKPSARKSLPKRPAAKKAARKPPPKKSPAKR